MHPANQRLRKPDKLFQGVHKQANYPRVQWENTLYKREATEPQGVSKKQKQAWDPERLEVTGECKVKEQEQEHRTIHAAGS